MIINMYVLKISPIKGGDGEKSIKPRLRKTLIEQKHRVKCNKRIIGNHV